MITVTATTTQTLADLVDFGLSPRRLRRILWPTTTGSRMQRRRKVNQAVRVANGPYPTKPAVADALAGRRNDHLDCRGNFWADVRAKNATR